MQIILKSLILLLKMAKSIKLKAAYIQWLDAHSQGNKWTDEDTAQRFKAWV